MATKPVIANPATNPNHHTMSEACDQFTPRANTIDTGWPCQALLAEYEAALKIAGNCISIPRTVEQVNTAALHLLERFHHVDLLSALQLKRVATTVANELTAPAVAPESDPPLTVSELGQLLSPARSAIVTNRLLADAGLQRLETIHNGRKQWRLSNSGFIYGVYFDADLKRPTDIPSQQIKWYRSVVKLITELAAD